MLRQLQVACKSVYDIIHRWHVNSLLVFQDYLYCLLCSIKRRRSVLDRDMIVRAVKCFDERLDRVESDERKRGAG